MSDTKTPANSYTFDWGTLAFGSKKPLRVLNATFIAAPRELSDERLTQLIKEYLPKGNIVIGIAKEQFVDGLTDQPQFRMLTQQAVQPFIDKVAAAKSAYKVYTLTYFQREVQYILQKIPFTKVLFVNGSWHHSFHLQPLFYTLANQHIAYERISPFVDVAEAKSYELATDEQILNDQPQLELVAALRDVAMLKLTQTVAQRSYDHTNQTGVILGRRAGDNYAFVASSFNKVVPYQTYAMHFGSLREQYFSPPNDLNHYDTIHAEVALLIRAQKRGFSLNGTTLFINVLPCPTCGRMLAETDIAEVVYRLDHSDGYTLGVLERAGKKVRRIVP